MLKKPVRCVSSDQNFKSISETEMSEERLDFDHR